LDPTKKYIFGYHPHGVYGISMFANIVFNSAFEKFFPGIQTLMTTLPANFYLPVWREYALGVGSGTCTRESLCYRLENGQPGDALVIVIGGAEEFRHMRSGTLDLVIKKRKGFARIALITGSSLVPLLGFGENELFEQITHPAAQPLHSVFQSLFKSSAPLFIGKYGTLLPNRVPLVTVGKFF
jgi:hypothetical protein